MTMLVSEKIFSGENWYYKDGKMIKEIRLNTEEMGDLQKIYDCVLRVHGLPITRCISKEYLWNKKFTFLILEVDLEQWNQKISPRLMEAKT